MTTVERPVGVRRIRADIRRMRVAHRPKREGTRAGDIYMVALGVFIYGGIVFQAVRGMIAAPPHGPELPNLATAQWLIVGFAVLAGGLLVRAMSTYGPVVASSHFQFWLLSTPLPRRALLTPRFWWMAGAGTVAGGLAGLASAALLGADDTGKIVSTTAGASLVAGAIAVSILFQARGNPNNWLSTILAAIGIGTMGVAVATALPTIDLPVVVTALAAVPVAAVIRAYGTLGDLNRVSLSTGAEILSATRTAVTFLDVTLFTGILSVRKWQRVGRVRSKPLAGTRYTVMLSADVRRLTRNRRTFLLWAGMLLAPYAATKLLPGLFVPVVQLVACTIAVTPLATGLRKVCQSPALSRSLGGSDTALKLTHLVAPTILALAWTALTLPAAATFATIIAPLGAVAFIYRRATQKPIEYAGLSVDSPFGLIPTDTIMQLSRGPMLLLLLAGVQLSL